MPYIILGFMVVQAVAGGVLLLRGMRSAQRASPLVWVHVIAGGVTPACWLVFLAQGSLPAAWSAFAVMTVGNAVGDAMLLRRWRGRSGVSGGFWRDYGSAIAAVFRGAMPRMVAFHALFSGVVYFATLGVCIGASVA